MNDLPQGWALARLDQVAEVRLGRQRSPKNHAGIRMRPYLRAANVTWSGLDLTDVKEMNFTEGESSVYELRKGDVLVAEASGSPDEVGKPALWRDEITGCCFQNTLVRVRSRGVLPEFLRYFLLAEARSGRIGRASPGVGIRHIGAARLSAWQVPVPPLAEQQRIVAAIEEQLSRLDAATALLDGARRRAQTLLNAEIVACVENTSWSLVRLSETALFITDGDHNPPPRVEEGIPHLTARNIRDGEIRLASCTFVTPEGYEQTKRRYNAQPGDVIVTCVGTIGETAVVPEGLQFSADRNLAAIRPASGFDSDYLRFALANPRLQEQMAEASGATAQPHLYLRDLRALEVRVPGLQEQRSVAAKLSGRALQVGHLRAAVSAAWGRAQALRRSSLDAAFRGQLVAQDPIDEPASVLIERIAAERAALPNLA